MSDSFDEPIGLRKGLSTEEYFAGPGVSKSQLDLVAQSPALVQWSRDAPVDEAADKAVDLEAPSEGDDPVADAITRMEAATDRDTVDEIADEALNGTDVDDAARERVTRAHKRNVQRVEAAS